MLVYDLYTIRTFIDSLEAVGFKLTSVSLEFNPGAYSDVSLESFNDSTDLYATIEDTLTASYPYIDKNRGWFYLKLIDNKHTPVIYPQALMVGDNERVAWVSAIDSCAGEYNGVSFKYYPSDSSKEWGSDVSSLSAYGRKILGNNMNIANDILQRLTNAYLGRNAEHYRVKDFIQQLGVLSYGNAIGDMKWDCIYRKISVDSVTPVTESELNT